MTATLNQRTTPAKPEVSFCHTITLSSRPPHPRATTDLLSVTLHWFAFPGILYKQNHTTLLFLLWLLLLGVIILRCIHVLAYINYGAFSFIVE